MPLIRSTINAHDLDMYTNSKVLEGKTLLANYVNVLQKLPKLYCFIQYIKEGALLQQKQTKGRKTITILSTHFLF